VQTFPAGSVSAPSITTTGDTNTGVFFPAADTAAITTGGTERMRIDSAGNVGIGAAPSAWQSATKTLQIVSGGATACSFSVNTSGGVALARNYYLATGGTAKYVYTSAASSYVQDTDGSHKFSSAPSGTADNAITFTQVLAIEKDKSLALQGATSQTGIGITFNANEVTAASTNANTLDDYEEGTWTPEFSGTDGSITITYSTQLGYYTKIGNIVKLTFNITASSAVTAGPTTGTLRIKSLPFTSRNNSGNNADSVAIGYVDNLTAYGTATDTLTALVIENSTVINFYNCTNAAVGTSPSPAALKNGSNIRGTVVYTV
jgi:hypothetical protein